METFSLNQEQVFILNKIYTKRRNLLIGFFIALPSLFRFTRNLSSISNYFDLTVMFIFLIILAVLYNKKVWSIRQDIKNLSGYYELKTITRKSYFEHVNTYYMFFDDVKMPNKEVTPEEFQYYQIGDNYKIPLSLQSKIVLDGFMNYSLL